MWKRYFPRMPSWGNGRKNMLPRRFLYVIFAFIVVFALVQTNSLKAQELEIKDCVLDKKQGRIRINFGLVLKNSEKLNQYLAEGSPLKLGCTGRLYKNRIFWMDKKLKENKLEFELDYNPLTQKYMLTNLNNKNSSRSGSLKKMLVEHWKELELDLGKWDSIPKDKEYTLQLEVSLKRGKVPGWMEVILFFWSWDQLSSKIYEIDFNY